MHISYTMYTYVCIYSQHIGVRTVSCASYKLLVNFPHSTCSRSALITAGALFIGYCNY